MQTNDHRISFVMPAYNEGSRIRESMLETMKTLDSLGAHHELVVIDDGSKDNTYDEALKAAKKKKNVKVVRYAKNYGKGHAVKEGYRYTTGNLVVFIDADTDIHPSEINRFLRVMEEQGADVVVGSKRHPKSRLSYPWHRKFLSDAYYIIVKILFGLPVKDTQAGLKLYRVEVLKRIMPKVLVKRYAFSLEILANAHHFGYKIVEAPITLNHHHKFGGIRLKDIFWIWWDTMAVFYRMYILHYYDKK